MTKVTILTSLSLTIHFFRQNIPSSPAYGVYMSQLIRYSKFLSAFSTSICPVNKETPQSWFHRNYTKIYKCFGRYHHSTIPYRISVTTLTNDICMTWYCCYEYFHSLIRHRGSPISWPVSHAEQEMLILQDHLISPLVFIEVHVVLSFVSLYFM